MSPSAGFRLSSAASTPRVTSSVFAPSCFSTISSRPGTLLMIASPIGGGKPSVTRRDVAEADRRAPRPAAPTIRSRSRAVVDGAAMRDREPLVRRVDEAAGLGRHAVARRGDHLGRASRALACSRSGSTSTCSCRSRWPQIATLATPGTAISRGRIVHSATVVMSICDSVFDVMPIFSARLSDESGDSSTGALRDRRQAAADARQPLLHELARLHQIRALRRGSARPTTGRAPTSIESSRRSGTPVSALSIGTLTNDSTSSADRPGASVCTSISGGANSGKTSNGTDPNDARAGDRRDDGQRADDDRVAQRERDEPAQHGLLAHVELGAVELRGADGDDRRRPRRGRATTMTLAPAGPPSSTRRRAN